MRKEILVYNTYINAKAIEKVSSVLNTTFISEGKLVKEFESSLNSVLGITNPIALNSGTTALHLALDLAGIKEGDEVILPAQTFVATGLVIVQMKAKPVFADIDYDNGNISVESIKQKITSKTKAIMIVHWGGYPCDITEILKIARENNIVIIEDAAHALGATYKNKSIGSLSDYTCFSFQAIKHVTTGDGGLLSVLDERNYNRAMSKRWFGIDRKSAALTELGERSYNINELGYKYHMNDYAAALGIANLEGFVERLSYRQKLADFYTKELAAVPGVSLFKHKKDRTSAHWLYGLHVENRLELIRSLKAKGITASVIHQRIDRNIIFGGITEGLIQQEKFDATQLHIPIHDAISEEDAAYVVDAIKKGW